MPCRLIAASGARAIVVLEVGWSGPLKPGGGCGAPSATLRLLMRFLGELLPLLLGLLFVLLARLEHLR